jgi:uncharacterized alpha-E superfamily protein
LSGSSVGFTNSTKTIGALKSQLEYIEIDEIISKGMHEYLDDIQRKLNNISSAIYNSFFVVQDNYSEVNMILTTQKLNRTNL